MPITRQGINPLVGWYGFRDVAYKDCSFGLLPSEDGARHGAVTTLNCETLLPRLARATRWETAARGHFLLWDGPEEEGRRRTPVRLIARYADAAELLELTILELPRKPAIRLGIRRLDVPNLPRPARLAAGWWTFSINDLPRWNDNRIALMINGRIGDASQCRPDNYPPLEHFAGGHWKADEGGVTLRGHENWRLLRYEGSGRKLVTADGNHMMVHDFEDFTPSPAP